MTSPLGALLAQVAADWVTLTPTTRTSVPYRELSADDLRRSATRDRQFAWAPPEQLEILGLTADGLRAQVRWDVLVTLFLSPARYTPAELAAAAADDTSQLRAAVDARTAWPSGVLYVGVRDVRPGEDEEGFLTYQFQLEAITEETAS